MKPVVVILTNKQVDTAPRVVREIEAIKDVCELLLIGNSKSTNIVGFYPLSHFRTVSDKILSRIDKLLSIHRLRFSGLLPYLKSKNVSAIVVHEPHFVSVALKLKKQLGCKVVFNAHEYHPREFEDDAHWMRNEAPKMELLYKTEMKHVDLLINVCESIRLQCMKDYGIDSLVIPNAAFLSNVPIYHSKNHSVIKIIHHGAIIPGRKIEKMISIVEQLGENYTLDIMGMTPPLVPEYYEQIRKRCAKSKNVKLIPPVSFSEIIPSIQKYDIGLYLLEPSNFNNFNALPNKLFEFIQAKLAIAVSPSPEMKRLVELYKLGVVSKDFTEESMIEAIKELSHERISEHKENAAKAAMIENAEKYQALFNAQIVSLTH